MPTLYDGPVPQASNRAAPPPFDVNKRATYVFDFGVAAPKVPDSIAPDGSLRKTIGASYFQLANMTVTSSDGTTVHVSSSQQDGKPRIHLCAIRRGVVLHKVEQSVVRSIERIVGMIALVSQVPTPLKGGLIYRYTGQVAGDDIHFMMYAGSPLARLLSTVAYPSNFASIVQPYHLPASVRPEPVVDAALRWYSKSLEAKDDVERFAFCWICFEILASQQQHECDPVPYIPDCGHELRECPVQGCHQSLMKRPGGKRWVELLASWGMDAQLAKDLWKTRMMFHGANRMEWKNVTKIPEQTTLLRKLLSSKLSEALQLSGGAIQPSHVGALQAALWCEKALQPDELSRWESAGLTRR